MNNSLTKVSYYDHNQWNAYPWDNVAKVMNPLSADLGVMRSTLVFGGLESLVRNINRKRTNLRFFEFGNCYHYNKEKDLPESPIKAYTQEQHLGLWLTGKRVEGSWIHPNEDSSIFELKAYVENILRRAGVPSGLIVAQKSDNNLFHEALTIKTRQGKVIAELGVLSKAALHTVGIAQPVYFADINWTHLWQTVKNVKIEFKELSKYPAVSRDLALLLDDQVEFAQVEQIARQSEKKLLKRVELFDVYEGDNLPAGKKSYAVNFILEDEEKTLNDKQIDAIMQKIIKNLKAKLGAELR